MSKARFDPEIVCRNLRCKEMFAEGDNAEYHGEKLFDPVDTAAYWCSKTQTGRGPDGGKVALESCSLGCARNCFVGLASLA